MTKDYGPDSNVSALKVQCRETDSGEYMYEHCFLTKITQPKKGGGHTGMGDFVRIIIKGIDEFPPANGKELGSGARIALKYKNRQHC